MAVSDRELLASERCENPKARSCCFHLQGKGKKAKLQLSVYDLKAYGGVVFFSPRS
jgi:hypothetical protein